MFKNISFSEFCDSFSDSYKDNFSYYGKKALFDYLGEYEESTGEEIELDTVALCCEYAEYEDIEDYLKNYNTSIERKDFEEDEEEEYLEAIENEIQDKTMFIPLYDYKDFKLDSFIIQSY